MDTMNELKPSVLLYNMTEGDDNEKIREYLDKTGVRIIDVAAADYLQPLGALAGVPGMERTANVNFGKGFDDRMIVMFMFDEMRMNAFLAYFRQEGIPSVALKAVMTPTNAEWDSIKLHDEIAKEHEMMHRKNRG